RSESRRGYKRGLDLARRLGDNETFVRAANLWLNSSSPLDNAEERQRLVEEMMQRPRTGISESVLNVMLVQLAIFFLAMGQRKQAEELLGELHALAERSRQVNIRLNDMRWQATLATIDGRLEEAVDIIQRILAAGRDLDLQQMAGVQVIDGPMRALLEFGQTQEVLEIVQDVIRKSSLVRALEARLAFCQAHLGRHAEVAEILGKLVLANPGADSDGDRFTFMVDIWLLEAATLSGHKEAAARLLSRFIAGTTIPPFYPTGVTCIFRLLGAARALLGDLEAARADYKEALRVSTDFKFRPEVALTRLQLAELLLEHYPKEKKEALEHLDFAIKEFREMKMQPSLERALRQKTILKA
ncbi:MAG: hypothetical protein AABZ77_07430, partial [Chloroflexota bacterium]